MSAALLEDALITGQVQGSPMRRRRRGARRLLGLLVPALLLGAWYVVSSQEIVSTRLIPAPGTVANALVAFFTGDRTDTLAGVVPFTGAGVGLMVPLRASAANMQFASRSGYLWLVLAMVVVALLVTAWLRHSRFGAYLQAVRDNEDAARAVGVDPFRVKLTAIALSAALMGAGGVFYVQVFQYIDPGIAYGPGTSVEALVAAIVGGMGTLWGPMLGALALHLLADLTRNLFGQLPGINMVIYGVVLVLIMMFMPRGVAGFRIPQRWRRRSKGSGRG